METKIFMTRYVERLRKRAGEYNKMIERGLINEADVKEERFIYSALNEVADCAEETLETFDE